LVIHPFYRHDSFETQVLGGILISVKFRIQPIVSSPWLIFSIALFARVTFVLYEGHRVPAEALATVPFQNEVGSVAAALARGQGFCCLFGQPTGSTAWLAPIYPFFLAGIFKIFGIFTVASFYVAALFNCAFSALACFPLFYATQRISNPATAALAAWLWAMFPSGILIPFEWIWDTSLSALLAITLLWANFILVETPRQRNFILYGLFWGFCLLVNPALGAVFPFLLLWIYFRLRRSQPSIAAQALLVAGLATLICAPWTIRNAVQFHRFIPIRSDYPFELWMGNNPIYDEHSREVNRITRYEQVHLYAQLGENAFLEEKRHLALTFMREHPTLCLRLAAQRAVAFWLGTPFPWQDFRRTDSSLARFVLFWGALMLVGTIAGLARLLLAQQFVFWPVAAYPLFFPLAYYLTQASLRYRHPCDPVLAMLMAIAATWPWLRSAPHANTA